MKILILAETKEVYKMFSDMFYKENSFFDVDFSSFIPKNLYYDAIIAESESNITKTIDHVPLILLQSSNSEVSENTIVIKDYSPKFITQILKQIYESNINIYSNNKIAIYKEQVDFYIGEKQLILNIENNEHALLRFSNSLKSYNLPEKIINQLNLIFCEFLLNIDNEILTVITKLENNSIKLSLPTKNINNTFGIQEFCDGFTNIKGGIEILFGF